MVKDIESSAAALYDGGWRSGDREQLIADHDLTAEEADDLCAELERLEAPEKGEIIKMDIYNGENQDITIVTDYGRFIIPGKSSAAVEVGEDAMFNQAEFYVEEDGDWYIKTENCATGCDAEIYNARG